MWTLLMTYCCLLVLIICLTILHSTNAWLLSPAYSTRNNFLQKVNEMKSRRDFLTQGFRSRMVRLKATTSPESNNSAASPTGTDSLNTIAQMSWDEIEAELEVLNVPFGDCISKMDLVRRLFSARAAATTRTKYQKVFSDDEDEEIQPKKDNMIQARDIPGYIEELTEDDLSQFRAADGTAPIGVPLDMAKALASDPKIVRLLQDPKMQDVLQAVMTQGPEAMKKYLADPDTMLLLEAFNRAIVEQLPPE